MNSLTFPVKSNCWIGMYIVPIYIWPTTHMHVASNVEAKYVVEAHFNMSSELQPIAQGKQCQVMQAPSRPSVVVAPCLDLEISARLCKITRSEAKSRKIVYFFMWTQYKISTCRTQEETTHFEWWVCCWRAKYLNKCAAPSAGCRFRVCWCAVTQLAYAMVVTVPVTIYDSGCGGQLSLPNAL